MDFSAIAWHAFVQGDRGQAGQGDYRVHHTHAGGQSNGGADSAEVVLNGGVRSIGYGGGPKWTVGSTVFELAISL